MGDSSNNVQSNEEFSAPAWLNSSLIERALQNTGDTREVVDLTVSLAIPPGENYISTIYRVKTKLSDDEEVSFIIKALAKGSKIAEFSKAMDIFPKEARILTDLIPKMEALLEHASPSQPPHPLAPRCLLHGDSPDEFLVLQDLGPLGFRLADRKRGLGLRHSLLALQSLARFHAASHALLRTQPELYESFGNNWRVADSSMGVYILGGLQALAAVCKTWPEYEAYADRLERNKENILQKCIELKDPIEGEFNVISHGDYWTTNILFKYQDGTPNDNRIIDFQGCHVASYALDVIHFVHTSLSDHVSIYHEDMLLREYHRALKETSTLLEIQVPTLQEFLSHYDACGTYSLYGAVCETPLLRSHKAGDLDASFDGDESANSFLYQTSEMRQWFQRILPKIDSKGWLPE